MAENNQFDSRNNEQEQEQKEQFRNFVESVAGGGNGKTNRFRISPVPRTNRTE